MRDRAGRDGVQHARKTKMGCGYNMPLNELKSLGGGVGLKMRREGE